MDLMDGVMSTVNSSNQHGKLNTEVKISLQGRRLSYT